MTTKVPEGVFACIEALRKLAMETRGSHDSFERAANGAASTYLHYEDELNQWWGCPGAKSVVEPDRIRVTDRGLEISEKGGAYEPYDPVLTHYYKDSRPLCDQGGADTSVFTGSLNVDLVTCVDCLRLLARRGIAWEGVVHAAEVAAAECRNGGPLYMHGVVRTLQHVPNKWRFAPGLGDGDECEADSWELRPQQATGSDEGGDLSLAIPGVHIAKPATPEPTAWDVGRHVARACASMNDRDAALKLILAAPCLWCGYNGQGYWSLRTHAEECPWHEIGGETERLLVLGAYTSREREEDT
jgi:hypothetical protein